jgi:hypothetical protein
LAFRSTDSIESVKKSVEWCGGVVAYLVGLLPEVRLYLVQPVLELPVVHCEHAQLARLLLRLRLRALSRQLLLVQLALQVPGQKNTSAQPQVGLSFPRGITVKFEAMHSVQTTEKEFTEPKVFWIQIYWKTDPDPGVVLNPDPEFV